MKVTVRLFAILKEKVGRSELTEEVEPGLTVEGLWKILTEEFPSLRPFSGCILFAVNQTYAKGNHLLQVDDEVALIPPVSGGCHQCSSK
jgi:molybdopterin converting factor subunit 1